MKIEVRMRDHDPICIDVLRSTLEFFKFFTLLKLKLSLLPCFRQRTRFCLLYILMGGRGGFSMSRYIVVVSYNVSLQRFL